MDAVIHIPLFLLGIYLVAVALYSAIATLVLPRGAQDPITRFVFVLMRRLFELQINHKETYLERDRIMAFFAPTSLLSLVPAWLIIILAGFALMFWSLGVGSWQAAFRLSGSSLLTLGFAASQNLVMTALSFAEAALGLIIIALLIAYLPSMYAAFSRRESAVTMLEVRAGNPPSVVEMIVRFTRIHGLNRLTAYWQSWEIWFADIEESHTSLPALVFFRSPQPDHSWVTAAGVILDSAAVTLSAVEVPNDPQAALCIRAGYLALRRIADFFSIPYHSDPHFPDQDISVSKEQFIAALDQLAISEVPLKQDREQAWLDYAGWRVNYDTALLALASLTMAPPAPWTGDRPRKIHLPPLVLRARRSSSNNKKAVEDR